MFAVRWKCRKTSILRSLVISKFLWILFRVVKKRLRLRDQEILQFGHWAGIPPSKLLGSVNMCVPVPLFSFQGAKKRKYNLILSFIFHSVDKQEQAWHLVESSCLPALLCLNCSIGIVTERGWVCCWFSSLLQELFLQAHTLYPGFPLSNTNCSHNPNWTKKSVLS